MGHFSNEWDCGAWPLAFPTTESVRLNILQLNIIYEVAQVFGVYVQSNYDDNNFTVILHIYLYMYKVSSFQYHNDIHVGMTVLNQLQAFNAVNYHKTLVIFKEHA